MIPKVVITPEIVEAFIKNSQTIMREWSKVHDRQPDHMLETRIVHGCLVQYMPDHVGTRWQSQFYGHVGRVVALLHGSYALVLFGSGECEMLPIKDLSIVTPLTSTP